MSVPHQGYPLGTFEKPSSIVRLGSPMWIMGAVLEVGSCIGPEMRLNCRSAVGSCVIVQGAQCLSLDVCFGVSGRVSYR